jgi:hypothetical protein
MLKLRSRDPVCELLIDEDGVTRHILATGSTGAGKTTGLLNPVLEQLVAWRAHEADRKVGLLVLDPQSDDTPAKVLAYADKAGRASDVVILSSAGRTYFDLVGGLHSLEQVDQYTTRRLLAGTRDLGEANAYWSEGRAGLVNTALTLLLANGPVRFREVIEFLQGWLFSQEPAVVNPKLRFVAKLLASCELSRTTRRRLELALLEVKNWAALDGRTREIFKSVLSNALRPLFSGAARAFFDESNAVPFRPQEVLQGKILIASASGPLAPLLFRVLKQEFYAALQSRQPARPEQTRLCGLLCDELPVSVTRDDVSALALIRARGGFMVACTQSFAALEEVLGRRAREALLNNFGSFFFFCSRENALDEFAVFTLGTREDRPQRRTRTDQGGVQFVPISGSGGPLNCPPGSLARLAQHQAFVKLADGTVTDGPVWLEPRFHEFVRQIPPLARDDLAEAVARVRQSDLQEAQRNPGVASFLLHMQRRNHRMFLTADVVAAVWQLCVPRLSRNRVLARARRLTLAGLESLPTCWLLGLVGWINRNQPLAAGLVEVSVRAGVLWVELDRASSLWGDGPMLVHERLNLAIYPSLYRPLRGLHLGRLIAERPDLRSGILALPQVASSPPGSNTAFPGVEGT